MSAARPLTATGSREFVTFRLSRQWLGVSVMLVQEVLVAQRIAMVPMAPAQVAGFLNLRGQIVTAVDLRTLLGLEPRPADQDYMNVVVHHDGELFAFMVDEVGDVITVEGDVVDPPPTTLEPRWRAAASGVLRRDSGLLIVLDLGALLALERSTS